MILWVFVWLVWVVAVRCGVLGFVFVMLVSVARIALG